jgi:small subunit ribosomal protein S17
MPDEETTETAETPEAAAPAAAPAEEATGRARRKVREGMVVSDKGHKTAIVAVTDRVRHRRYNKTVQRTTRLHAHDETNDAHVGDKVRIAETRPLSKLKRWRLVEVLERAK